MFNILPLYQQSPFATTRGKKVFENIQGNEEMLVTCTFFFSYNVFDIFQRQFSKFEPLFFFCLSKLYLFPKQQILDSSKLKELADDTVKFDENGSEFPKRVANTVEKGEIARNEQFLLFPYCFQKTCTADT